MLDPKVRVGTSTPKADPAGDYAFALFAKAEGLKPGVRHALESKALQLTGGPTSEKAPPDRNPYAWVIETGRADLFLTYCTNAAVSHQEMPETRVIELPPALSVGADYGVTALTGSRQADAARLIAFLLSSQGQAILRRHGFSSPGG